MATIFRTASTYLKVALIFLTLGIVLFVIGFSTHTWTEDSRYHTSKGLWTHCTALGCSELCNENSFHKAIQAFECIGLIGYGLALLALLFYFITDSYRRRDTMQAATIFVCGGIVFAVIGFIMANSNNIDNYFRGSHLGWSQGIAMAGTGSCGVTAIMLILHLCGC